MPIKMLRLLRWQEEVRYSSLSKFLLCYCQRFPAVEEVEEECLSVSVAVGEV